MEQRLSALVVDDERATREGIVRGLDWARLGIGEVREAADGLEALGLARERQPDILLCDVRMPRMDGVELASTIRQSYPWTQVVFLSGYADKEYLKAALRLGAIDYVEKPLDLEELAAAVGRAVAAAHLRAAAWPPGTSPPPDPYHAIEAAARALADPSAPVAETVEAAARGRLPLPPSGRLLTLVCRVDRTGVSPGQALSRTEIERELARLLPAPQGGCLYAVGPDEVLLHLALPGQLSAGDLAEHAGRLRAALVRMAGTERVAVGVGRIVSGMLELQESAASAAAALAAVFALGYGVHFYRVRTEGRAAIEDTAIAAALVERVSAGDPAGVDAVLSRFGALVRESCRLDPDAGRQASMRVALEIERLLSRSEAAAVGAGRPDLLWKVVSASPTIDDAVGHIRESALSLARDNEGTIRQGHAVSAALRTIEARFREDLGAAEIAREVGISANYLSTMFRRATGKTISETISEVRVHAAKDLLLKRELRVVDVAERVGYRDEKYFTRVFRKVAGMSPSAWRRAHA